MVKASIGAVGSLRDLGLTVCVSYAATVRAIVIEVAESLCYSSIPHTI